MSVPMPAKTNTDREKPYNSGLKPLILLNGTFPPPPLHTSHVSLAGANEM